MTTQTPMRASGTGLFNAVLGEHRGTPERDTIAAAQPTAAAQADFRRLMAARRNGETDELFRLLGRHRSHLAERPLLRDAACVVAAESVHAAAREHNPIVMAELGLRNREAQARVRDSMERSTEDFASKQLTRKNFPGEEPFRELVESFWRRAFVPALVAELREHPEMLAEMAPEEWRALRSQLPDDASVFAMPGFAGDLRDRLRDALDANQRQDPVLDSLSDSGAQEWRFALRQLLGQRIEFTTRRRELALS